LTAVTSSLHNIIMGMVIKSEEKRLVFGEVYAPYDTDTDNEAMTPDEIEKAAHNFMLHMRQENVDLEHDQVKTGCVIVESFIARKCDPDFREGAWVAGAFITKDDLWQQIKAGEINGYSFGGQVVKQKVEAVVEMVRLAEGYTEDSTEDSVPVHKHHVTVMFNDEGRMIQGKTDTFLEHAHPISKATATDEAMGHSHRMVLE